jgi:hypothetical protein
MAKKTRKNARKTSPPSPPSQPPITAEHHHYYSKTTFDGKNIVSETQKDDEPMRRRVYTLKQLSKEIPLAGELVKEHLGGVVPRTLSYPILKNVKFRSVLPSPAEMGLLPPTNNKNNNKNKNKKTKRRHMYQP